jgi:two-component system LytT family response regulator
MAEADGKRLRALVADDEPFARERVRRLLAVEPDVELVGEARDGLEAVAAIRREHPNLLFLDVQMPGKDGFQVLESLAPEETPVVIFLTAYDQYAVRAFQAAALDYLLKPFDEDRFKKAVARARAQVQRLRDEADVALAKVGVVAQGAALVDGARYLERLLIRTGGRVLFRRTDEIDWIEAYGNYVRLHVGKATYLMRESLSRLETRLDPAQFARIHRSIIVQIARIREISPSSQGQSSVLLEEGTRLTVSRRYRRRLPPSLRPAV